MKDGIHKTKVHEAINQLIRENYEAIQAESWLRVSFLINNESGTHTAESIILVDFSQWKVKDAYYWIEAQFNESVWQLFRYALKPGSSGTLIISITRSLLHGRLGFLAKKQVQVRMPADSLL